MKQLLAATTAMAHRRPKADCPLCPLWGVPYEAADTSTHFAQHQHAARIWDAWGGGLGYWQPRVVEAAAEMGVSCTVAEATEHFEAHRVEQPSPGRRARGYREQQRWLAADLTPRQAAVLRAVGRRRVMTVEQVAQLIYSVRTDGRSASPAYAMRKAREDLQRLAGCHLLYRYYPSESDEFYERDGQRRRRKGLPAWFGRRALYFAGTNAAEFLAADGTDPESLIELAAQVRPGMLAHDLGANDAYVAMVKAARERGFIVGLPAQAGRMSSVIEIDPANWYGNDQLRMELYDPYARTHRRIIPDGFAALSLPRQSWEVGPGVLPSVTLPFFYEFDRDNKRLRTYTDPKGVVREGVVEQMMRYHLLAVSRSAGKRFPDLDVRGYAVPVIAVFPDEKRLKSVHRGFARYAAELGIETGAPVVFVTQTDWEADPFADGICTLAWDKPDDDVRRHSLLRLLLLASAPLIEAGTVSAGQKLRLDLDGARPKAKGAFASAKRPRVVRRSRLVQPPPVPVRAPA